MIPAESAGNSNILLVDGTPHSRAVIRDTLAQAGFVVHAAADGAGALAQLGRAKADLIILDLRLPGVASADLAGELRALPGAGEVPTLALAGIVQTPHKVPAGQFFGMLFRPVDTSLLLKTVSAHLKPNESAALPANDRPVLIIDDDPIQLKLLALRLCHMGFAVLLAHDGETGLEQARNFHPAAILSRVLMPGMDGFQFCVQARADAMLARIPIILLTHNPVRHADQLAAQRLGAHALVQSDAEFRGAARALLAGLNARPSGAARPRQMIAAECAGEVERHTGLNYELARRCAAQSTRLAVLARIDESLIDGSLSRTSLHQDCLAQLIDVTGFPCGAILARDDEQPVTLSAYVGLSDATAKLLPGFFAAQGSIDEALKRSAPMHVQSRWSGGETRFLMSAIGAETAWISPLRYNRHDFGFVLLVSPVSIAGSQWVEVAQSAVEEIARVTALRQAIHRLRSLASFDAVTALPNRAYLEWQLQKFAGERKPGALYLLKLERFQELRGVLGASNSQSLCRQLAARLRATLPVGALVACLGYDEFAVLRTDTTTAESIDCGAQQLLDGLKPAFKLSGLPIALPITVGVADLTIPHGDAETIVACADSARRQAREAGCDYVVYKQRTDAEGADHLALLGALRQAIGRNELALHYQPKVRLDNGATVGVEALLRWRHPEFGWIAPNRFIPLAEQAGLIYPLTLWVAGSALAQAKVWRAAGRPVEVAVNVSACDLRDPEFPDILAKLCDANGAAHRDLSLEVSERSLSADPARAVTALTRLNDFGFSLTLDDFGAGHCSLANLQELPIKELKIDRSFISSLSENPRSSAMVRSIIDLGRNLDVGVVAKGIESQQSWDVLDQLGCDMGQGFFICRPQPPDEFARRAFRQTELAV